MGVVPFDDPHYGDSYNHFYEAGSLCDGLLFEEVAEPGVMLLVDIQKPTGRVQTPEERQQQLDDDARLARRLQDA